MIRLALHILADCLALPFFVAAVIAVWSVWR